jgi:hypothetical protein
MKFTLLIFNCSERFHNMVAPIEIETSKGEAPALWVFA